MRALFDFFSSLNLSMTAWLILAGVSVMVVLYLWVRLRQKPRWGRVYRLFRKLPDNQQIITPTVKRPAPPPQHKEKFKPARRPPLERLDGKPLDHQEEIVKPPEDIKIVDIAQPVGVWTRMIIAQKLDYLMMRLRMGSSQSPGYWTNLIKAQESSKREKGRGR